jgi:hypothetical protein
LLCFINWEGREGANLLLFLYFGYRFKDILLLITMLQMFCELYKKYCALYTGGGQVLDNQTFATLEI